MSYGGRTITPSQILKVVQWYYPHFTRFSLLSEPPAGHLMMLDGAYSAIKWRELRQLRKETKIKKSTMPYVPGKRDCEDFARLFAQETRQRFTEFPWPHPPAIGVVMGDMYGVEWHAINFMVVLWKHDWYLYFCEPQAAGIAGVYYPKSKYSFNDRPKFMEM